MAAVRIIVVERDLDSGYVYGTHADLTPFVGRYFVVLPIFQVKEVFAVRGFYRKFFFVSVRAVVR